MWIFCFLTVRFFFYFIHNMPFLCAKYLVCSIYKSVFINVACTIYSLTKHYSETICCNWKQINKQESIPKEDRLKRCHKKAPSLTKQKSFAWVFQFTISYFIWLSQTNKTMQNIFLTKNFNNKNANLLNLIGSTFRLSTKTQIITTAIVCRIFQFIYIFWKNKPKYNFVHVIST